MIILLLILAKLSNKTPFIIPKDLSVKQPLSAKLCLHIGKILVCLIASLSVSGQFRLDNWTTDNGLPQNSVTGLTRTTDGYIWLTTNDGLVRFDGVKFKIFNKSNTSELTTNRLVGAFEDKSGRLWFQSEDGGIIFYQKGRFNVAMKPNEIPIVLRSPFFDDQAGGVIFYTNNNNYRYTDGKFVPYKVEGLREDCVIILADREGGLWFTDKGSVHRVKNGQITTYDLKEFTKGEVYKVAYEDRNGAIWLGYAGEVDQSNDSKLLRIKDERVQSIDFPGTPIRHFAEDMNGNLLMSVYDKGIYRIDNKFVSKESAPRSEDIKQIATLTGMSANTSGFLCPDREGGMWVGTEKGLIRLSPQTIRVFSKNDGLPEENVYPIYQDNVGNIWAGIWQSSLVKYENGFFKTFPKTSATTFISTIFEDKDGKLWTGNIGSLHYLLNGNLMDFTSQAGFHDYTEFSVITQTGDGSLWFGTNRGLSRYANGQSTVFTTSDGLPDDYIVAVLQSKDGKLWIGTRGGIASIENGKINSFTTANGLASNYVRSLYEDAEGFLWIGSYDGGLTRYKDGKFTSFTMKDGLSSNGVFCILEDDHGWFWMNSNQGIYRVNRQDLNNFADGKTKFLTSIAYNKQDGLLNIEGNGGRQPAGIKARDGKLWFPTAQGIAVVDPETVPINPLPPSVIIEEILIDRSPVENEIYQAAVHDQQSAVTLTPNQNNMEINYTGLSFINSEQVKFKYKLVGLDQDWNEVGTRRTAYYSFLPPGDYTFQVIAANRDGVWNTSGAIIKVKVLPVFYRTWWFLTFCLLCIIIFAFLMYRLRVMQLEQKTARQEDFARQLIDSQEFERGRIAGELHDGLSQSLVIIKNRAMLSLTKPDDHERALEQLKEIAEASTHAIDEVKDIIYDLRPIQLDRLGLTRAIEDMAENVAEANELELIKKFTDIDNIFPKEFENSLYRIVQESLNNIIKHSGAAKFEIEINKTKDQVEIFIKDNGQGFIIGAADKKTAQKGGFGLIGIVERAKLLGGSASIESNKDAGTAVSIIIPITLNQPVNLK